MRIRTALVVVLGGALLVAGCGSPDRTAQIPRPAPTAASSSPPASNKCSPPATASYKPSSVYSPGSFPGGSNMAKIVAKKQLVVGISADSRLLGSRNLVTGRFQGIDIEMANRVSDALFGDHSPAHLVFKTINASQRIPLLQNDQIDMVARAMTMNCLRWTQVAFSEPYFVATQRVLVRKGAQENSLAALAKGQKKVCATNGSTSIDRLRAEYGGAKAVGVALTTDCLVLWQQGQVDAITGDDAILAGLAQQDPSAEVAGPTNVGAEPYGLAVKKENVDFVRFLNALLEQMRSNGQWKSAYASSGLEAVLGAKSQPVLDDSRG
jgi:polar amino acid transport system substrate-binding protein